MSHCQCKHAVLVSIPASADTVESEERQMEAVLNEVVKKYQKSSVKKRKEQKVTQLSSILDCKNEKHTVYSTVHYPHHKKREKCLFSGSPLLSVCIYFDKEGWGRRGRVGKEGEGGGVWVIYHLLGCVLPPPAHAEKTHNNKHSQDTELIYGWPAKFF